jgi:hypothetical protein
MRREIECPNSRIRFKTRIATFTTDVIWSFLRKGSPFRYCYPHESPYFIDLDLGAIRLVFVGGPPEDGMELRDEERGSRKRALLRRLLLSQSFGQVPEGTS